MKNQQLIERMLDGDLPLFSADTNHPLSDSTNPLVKSAGGGLGCDRPWRDAVYDFNTRLTSLEVLQTLRDDQRAASIGQHIVVAALDDETWRRSESELRRTLAADQLISWCKILTTSTNA